jgi:N-acetylmuramoyl-L-alanine amidase
MRAGNIDRVKRQLLHEAVSDNVDVIRGVPPRSKRPKRAGEWWRRSPLLLVPLAIIGSGYLIGGAPAPSPTTVVGTPPRAAAPHYTAGAAVPDSFEPVKAAAFPLAVKRVVLDAGHGGKDAGTSSASLVSEKEITLTSSAVFALLEHNGLKRRDALMTP